jgi:hypothetical protein
MTFFLDLDVRGPVAVDLVLLEDALPAVHDERPCGLPVVDPIALHDRIRPLADLDAAHPAVGDVVVLEDARRLAVHEERT